MRIKSHIHHFIESMSMTKTALILLSSILLLVVMITSLSSVSSAEDVVFAAEPLNLEGIWTMNLGSEQITMMIRQHESRLVGACTGGDSNPWNAVITGSLAGNEVELRAQSLRSGVIVETTITGDTNGESINGSFLQGDSLGKVTGGEAAGFKIDPDTSQYSSAAVTAPEVPLSQDTQEKAATDGETEGEIQPATRSDKSRFVDVASQKERVLYLGWAWTPGETSDKEAVKI